MGRGTTTPRPQHAALILTGAIAKGAFEAGALSVVAERGIPVRRIVAASSGALNGVAYAAGVRAGGERASAARLVDVWQDRASFFDIIHVSFRDLLCRRGLSDQKKLLALLRDNVRPTRVTAPSAIDLRILVAPLRGVPDAIDDVPATTYTHVARFSGEYFDDSQLLEHVFRAATASAAFPYLFVPVDLPWVGPCIDGGLVNTAPIQRACGDLVEPPIDLLLVTAPTPTFTDCRVRGFPGKALGAQLIDMLFSERLFQDLRSAEEVNEALQGLGDLGRRKGWSPEEVAEVERALGWGHRRVVPVVWIRPLAPLPGHVFSGFFSEALRRRYVELGVERASRVLDDLGWT